MLTIEKLKEFGADVDKGLPRCGNNEALYLRLVKMITEELSGDALGVALREGDTGKAFEIAHKLKGGVENLSLTPISVPVCELTELLRNKIPGDYDGLYSTIVEKTEELKKIAE